MVHQPRRRRARVAVLLLGALLVVGVVVGRRATDGPLSQPPARAATGGEPTEAATALLDARTAPVFAALNRERAEGGLPPLVLDEALVDDAASAACAIARGDMALSGEAMEDGTGDAVRENVGLVIEEDPAAGAMAMHGWWTGAREHRRDRMDPAATRYGIGACGDGDRTYYVERLTPESG
jgi:uncharacterized protein YkwD